MSARLLWKLLRLPILPLVLLCSYIQAQTALRTFEASTSLPNVTAMAADAAGHIYVAGYYDAFSPQAPPPIPANAIHSFEPPMASPQGYVARVSPWGDAIFWIAQLPISPQTLRVDSSGNIIATGTGVRSNVPGVVTPCVSKDNPTMEPSQFGISIAPALLTLSPDG